MNDLYNPLPEIVKDFFWAVINIQKQKKNIDKKKFYEIAYHLEKEIKKYIFK